MGGVYVSDQNDLSFCIIQKNKQDKPLYLLIASLNLRGKQNEQSS